MIYTSYFANAGKHPMAVAICNGTRGYPGVKTYKALAPEWNDIKALRAGSITEAEFNVRFNAKLAKLDPHKCAGDLRDMVGGDPIMLCWEKIGDECHRHTVAEWMKRAGLDVEELAIIPKEAKGKKAKPAAEQPVQQTLL